MDYYVCEPEVAGGLGPHTVLDPSVHPPHVSALHYVFEGWLGDALVTSFPCYLVTTTAAEALQSEGVTGMTFTEAEISTSPEYDEFQEHFPTHSLPPFVWMQVVGVAGVDDIGLTATHRLALSSKAVQILSPWGLAHARLEAFTV